jgi:cell division protein FtsN
MSKDYKAAPPRAKAPENRPSSPNKSGNPLMIGLLIGLLIGIALSVGVALSVNKSESAFQDKAPPAPPIPIAKPESKAEEAAEPVAESIEISSQTVEPPPERKTEPGKVEAGKKEDDRFTFYDILTKTEPPTVKTDGKSEAKTAPETPPEDSVSTKTKSEKLFLQVGAFKTEQDADNAKAKLALIGLDAVIQSVSTPDKGLLHRVRVGPFANQDELGRVRTELTKNGFGADLVRSM